MPEDFRTYDEFVVWIHQNPGVCVRNLNVIGTTKTNYEQLDGLKNPEDKPRHAAFYLTATNVPVGTTIGMQCEPAKLEASVVTSSETRDAFGGRACRAAAFRRVRARVGCAASVGALMAGRCST